MPPLSDDSELVLLDLIAWNEKSITPTRFRTWLRNCQLREIVGTRVKATAELTRSKVLRLD